MMVERKRPSGTSPISLTPRVEPIATPAAPTSVAEASAGPAAPPAQSPEPAANAEAPPAAAARRRLPAPRTRSAEPPTPAPVGGAMVSRTFRFQEDLIRRAETAVLRTGGLEGGHVSMTALLSTALERELARLEHELNDGEPFPANRGEFRRGRPIGS